MPSRLSTHFVCARCLSRRRLFSSSSKFHLPQSIKQHGLPQVPPSAGYVRLTDRAIISISGADSTAFLQGMITQSMLVGKELVHVPRRMGFYSAFLNAQGRVLHDVFIYPSPAVDGSGGPSADGHSWLIEVDRAEVQNLMKHLKKHKLRAKFAMRALDEGERSVWASWNEHAEPRWAAYNLESDCAWLRFPHRHPGSQGPPNSSARRLPAARLGSSIGDLHSPAYFARSFGGAGGDHTRVRAAHRMQHGHHARH
jgi:hypothetical protein